MAEVVEMFSEVNTSWVEVAKVAMVGTLQIEWRVVLHAKSPHPLIAA